MLASFSQVLQTAGRWVILLATVLALPAMCRADEVADQFEALHRAGGAVKGETQVEVFRRELQSAAASVANGDFQQAAQTASRASYTAETKPLREAWQELAKSLQSLAEKRRQELIRQGEEALKRAGVVCREAKTADEVDAARNMLRDLQRRSVSDSTTEKLNKSQEFLSKWRGILAEAELEHFDDAKTRLDQLLNEHDLPRLVPMDQMRKKSLELADLRLKRAEAFVAEARRRLAGAETVEQARAVAEWLRGMDAPLGLRRSGSDSWFHPAHRAPEVVRLWLQMLESEQAGDWQDAFNYASQLASADRSQLLDRKRLLAWQQKLANALDDSRDQAVKAETKELNEKLAETLLPEQLDDLGVILQRQVNATPNTHFSRPTLNEISSEVQYLRNTWQLARQHRFDQFWNEIAAQRDRPKHPWNDWVIAMKTRMVVSVLQSQGRIKGLAPRARDAPGDLLLRAADEAAAAGDWQRVYLVLEAYSSATRPSGAPERYVQREMEACRQFLAGQSYEQAGEPIQAIAAYDAVLQNVGRRVPRKEAEERLKALSKHRPKPIPAAEKKPTGELEPKPPLRPGQRPRVKTPEKLLPPAEGSASDGG